MTKLTIIGAGSAVFTKNIFTDLMFIDDFKKMDIALVDIDEKRLKISHQLLRQNLSNRGELNHRILKTSRLDGFTGTWSLVEKIWIKNMEPYKISRGEILKLSEIN